MNATVRTARRLTVATLGALLIATAGTAYAAEPMSPNAPLTVADWQANVGRQLDAKLPLPAALARHDHLIARVQVAFDAHGDFAGAKIVQSTGEASADSEVLRTANRIAYPPLPAGLRGRPQIVILQAYLGNAADVTQMARHERAAEALAAGAAPRHDANQTAALPEG